jgi:hypothetical protein
MEHPYPNGTRVRVKEDGLSFRGQVPYGNDDRGSVKPGEIVTVSKSSKDTQSRPSEPRWFYEFEERSWGYYRACDFEPV